MCTLHVMESKRSFFVIKIEEAQRNDPNQYPEQKKKVKFPPKTVNNHFYKRTKISTLETTIFGKILKSNV